MNLAAITIVLDGKPWIERHYIELQKSGLDFLWIIREGAASNTHCTNWCKPQEPRLSQDGTTDYLKSIASDPRVDYKAKELWDGKVSMFNDAVESIKGPCILLEIDHDELWSAHQLEILVKTFQDYGPVDRAYFWCAYYVGPDIVTCGNNAYGNKPGEWLRAWRFKPGMKFITHEPPRLHGCTSAYFLSRDFTRSRGLVFKHMAYATEPQLRFKESFYGYKDAVKHWRRLQSNTRWPVKRLKEFLPWVDEGAMADRL